MMKCKICRSESTHIQTFTPYIDKPWSFDVFECPKCITRFCPRENSINYYEELHAEKTGPYFYQHTLAQKVKSLLENKKIHRCETLLKNTATKYAIILDFIEKRGGDEEILEIGCSTGFFSALLRAKGYKAYGIDISNTAIDTAVRLFGSQHYGHTVEAGTHYDVIFHTGLIGCIDNPKKFLDTYLRFLKTNGTMIFNAPNVFSAKQLNEIWIGTPPPDVIYAFSERSFTHMIDRDQYEIKISKTYSPFEILQKHMARLFGYRLSRFPKRFNQVQGRKLSWKSKVINGVRKAATPLSSLLISAGLLEKLDDQYGLIVTIKRLCNP